MKDFDLDKIIVIIKEMKNDQSVNGQTPLLDSGFLDSFDIITLVSQLEETFQVMVPGDEIIPENFNTVEDIAAMVQKQKET